MSTERPGLLALWWRFLMIGSVAFGGFMALISVVEDVFVRQLGWIESEDMLDGISLANVMPGPQAVNTVTYVGYRIAGLPGALVSFIGILTPTWVLVTILTFLYFGVARDMEALDGFFAGLVPAVAAVIFAVVYRMRKKAVTGRLTWTLTLATAAILLFVPTAWKLTTNLSALVVAAAVGVAWLQPAASSDAPLGPLPLRRIAPLVVLPLALAGLYLAAPPLPEDSIAEITLTFSGLSVMLFGGGYVFIPMILDVVVTQEGWLTAAEFNDGIAFSQITPGPIMISAAFIGQKVLMAHGPAWGVLGSLCATLGIFAPPAVLMVGAAQLLDHIKRNQRVQGALRGVRAAVVGMIGVAAILILQTALPQTPLPPLDLAIAASPTLAILAASLIALVRWRVGVIVVLPAAGIVGAFLL